MTRSNALSTLACHALVTTIGAFASELAFEPLLEKVVRACADLTKAERAVLVLDEGGFFIRASATQNGDITLERRPLAASRSVPVSVIEHVFAARELVVLGDARREGRYTGDPHISAHDVRSVLAAPVAGKRQLLGVVYLEIKARAGAFTPDRIEMVRLLSGHVAVALENSRLYERCESRAPARWQATIDATAEGILVADIEGKISAVNEPFLRLWQIPADAADESHHLRLLRRILEQLDDPEAFVARVQAIYERQDQKSSDLVRFRDGRIFEHVSAPQYVGEKITGRVWTTRDVTERESLLQRALFLADATRLLASLDVEQALEGVAHLAVPYLGDCCAIDVFADGDRERRIAVSRDTSTSSPADVHPSVLKGHAVTYEAESGCHLSVPLLTKGRLVGAMAFSASRDRRYTPGEVHLAEELGRRAALSIDNAHLYRRVRDALQARDEFLSIAAHEIRGPVSAIHLAVQSIRQGMVPPDALPRLFELVERQDRRLSQFVEELLDLGRIQAGKFHLEYEDVNLGEIVREVVERLSVDIARSGSSLRVQEHGTIIGRWDKSRLDQVVSNLVSNAIKFGQGRPIDVTLEAHGERARLVVQDQGLGIDREAQKRIFRPFERGVSVRHFGGLGLGLHIVETIVRALGGSVAVESEPGTGSKFTVVLPQRRHEDNRL